MFLKPSQGCMCVCMYACMYVCVYMHIYACACMQCLICTAKRSKHAASTKADGPPSALPFRYLQWESPQDHCQRWGWSRPITHTSCTSQTLHSLDSLHALHHATLPYLAFYSQRYRAISSTFGTCSESTLGIETKQVSIVVEPLNKLSVL